GLPYRPVFSFPLLRFFPISHIHAKDVMIITGHKSRAAWKFLSQIRKKLRKKKGFVTTREFSALIGIDEESIFATIN
ncbi:MAG: hypothetical protein ACXVBX_04895, partial [Flavisolibacter sp.]